MKLGRSTTGSRRRCGPLPSWMIGCSREADDKPVGRMRFACEKCEFASEEVSAMACAKSGGAKKCAKSAKKAAKKKK
ncbi:MAG: hypothetical protein JSV65_02505 [Armatimonadota bacterium]|nr:MAG: hypothetical protein JSV65_02505 [Armatimonadota bacterium]